MDGKAPRLETADERIARNARKYDTIPYVSKPFPQTHPLRLGGIARLFGIDATPLAGARMLEIGCAAGGNLIPLAALNPQARFLGLDISPRQVEQAQARIARLGLTNIEIRCQSFTEFAASEGPFDYIVAHGVFSWVPEDLQEALLALCKTALSPRGLAYVSYNVLPGWRMWQTLRDAFALMIPPTHDEQTRVGMARDLLEFLRDNTPEKGPYGEMLRTSHDRLKDLPDYYVAHEYLEDANQPISLRDFVERAGRHGMTYLGEADYYLMFPGNHGQSFARALLESTTNDIISIEQMIDVLTGRTFRQTILIGSERIGQIQRKVTVDALKGMHFLPQPDMKLERNGADIRISDSAGRMLGSNRPAVIRAIERLLAAFPGSADFAHCAAGASADEQREVMDALFRLVVTGMVYPLSEPMPAGIPQARPRTLDIARNDMAAGLTDTVNIRHESVGIDPVSAVVLEAMDGIRNRRVLEDAIVEAALSGRIEMKEGGLLIRDKPRLRAIAAEILPRLLESLRACGLVAP